MATKPRTFPYGVLIDETDVEADELFGYEHFYGDSEKREKRMDEIIITAANYAAAPGGPLEGHKHFSWMCAPPMEDPTREES